MSPLDFSVEELGHVLDLADDIKKNPEKYAHVCDGKKIATLFYEPSTRTRLSFEAAMMNLGGKALGFSSASSSSAAKGESVADTIRVVSCFADICAMRHPKEGAPLVASMHSSIPVSYTHLNILIPDLKFFFQYFQQTGIHICFRLQTDHFSPLTLFQLLLNFFQKIGSLILIKMCIRDSYCQNHIDDEDHTGALDGTHISFHFIFQNRIKLHPYRCV